jgi:hypothetical protein
MHRGVCHPETVYYEKTGQLGDIDMPDLFHVVHDVANVCHDVIAVDKAAVKLYVHELLDELGLF